MKTQRSLLAIVGMFYFSTSAYAQHTQTEDAMQKCPMHKEHSVGNSHHAIVERNGTPAMGFSQTSTTHHFRLLPDGGAIEVTTNQPNDRTDMLAIRTHLSQIASMFSNGDFSTPMFVHDSVPPGVTTMKALKALIHYRYEEIPAGGRVRIQSSDPASLGAVHDFLRFQISEHRTGDALEVTNTQ